ncbi:MAG: UDP-N-acetylmuramoyl-L-alanine--D-glutamate ligase [Lachnospiraceae bacterium]|nr:UDP-N-acetylmuramoyl-L-alanine--D-glutamate ligase [Lachnospiraceae bacterium]MDD3616006.1 UDP-N-acetylmuramoyl-L-alanine--D-glutamate ligase [Lachnospiraceae bacterium]
MELKGKRVLVFGSGISGIAAAKLLCKVQAVPVIYDGNTKADKAGIIEKTGQDIQVILGELAKEEIEQIDLVVMSPGVPTDIPLVDTFRECQIPVWGEIELAYEMSKGSVLAITGTNGKTTTTALLGQIMQDYCKEVYVVGNIGTPYTSIAMDTTGEAVTVAEISSFQLETIEEFHPKVSAILNITPDHLNRHHTMEEYIRVKELITKNQTSEDLCVLNYEDEVLREFASTLKTKVLFFSSVHILERGIYYQDGTIWLQTPQEKIMVVNVDDLKLLGMHNYENVMAAVAMAYGAGVPMDSIRKTVCAFTSVEHRIEYVTEKNGVTYYNDSKGTNPDAAIKGIQAMNRPTYLIGGGYDKDSDYTEWIQAFDGKVKCLVLIGQTREKIEKTAHDCGFMDTLLADNLEEAVKICADKAKAGEAVLLSPACASWGQFENYEIRGKMFKEYVQNL